MELAPKIPAFYHGTYQLVYKVHHNSYSVHKIDNNARFIIVGIIVQVWQLHLTFCRLVCKLQPVITGYKYSIILQQSKDNTYCNAC